MVVMCYQKQKGDKAMISMTEFFKLIRLVDLKVEKCNCIPMKNTDIFIGKLPEHLQKMYVLIETVNTANKVKCAQIGKSEYHEIAGLLDDAEGKDISALRSLLLDMDWAYLLEMYFWLRVKSKFRDLIGHNEILTIRKGWKVVILQPDFLESDLPNEIKSQPTVCWETKQTPTLKPLFI